MLDETPQTLKQTLCEICDKQFSNYNCPRCNLRYCSLVCYKNLQHGECTENFYKKSVTEEIQNQSVDQQSKNKMLMMLKRLEQEEEDPLEEQDELQELFQDLNLDTADPEEIWSRLPEKERKEFTRMLTRLDNVWHKLDIPDYIPWWRLDIQKIYALDDDSPLPPLPTNMPNIQIKEIRPHMVWNLLHILITYSYLMRHNTGNMHQDDSIKTLRALSQDLLFSTEASCPFRNVDDVISDCVERILRFQKSKGAKARYDLKCLFLQDLTFILPHSQHAILDLWQAMDTLRPKTKSLNLATRKAYYYGAVALALDSEIIIAAVKEALYRVEIDQKEFEKDCQAANLAIEKQTTHKIQEI